MKVGDLVSILSGHRRHAGYITKIVNQDVYVVLFQRPEWGERRTNWTMLKIIK